MNTYAFKMANSFIYTDNAHNAFWTHRIGVLLKLPQVKIPTVLQFAKQYSPLKILIVLPCSALIQWVNCNIKIIVLY